MGWGQAVEIRQYAASTGSLRVVRNKSVRNPTRCHTGRVAFHHHITSSVLGEKAGIGCRIRCRQKWNRLGARQRKARYAGEGRRSLVGRCLNVTKVIGTDQPA